MSTHMDPGQSDDRAQPREQMALGTAAGAPWPILVRYGRGEETADELAVLRDWVRDDASRQALLDGVRRLGDLSQRGRGGTRTEAAWGRMRQHLMHGGVSTPVLRLTPGPVATRPPLDVVGQATRRGRWWRAVAAMAIAAAVVIAVGVAVKVGRPAWLARHSQTAGAMYQEAAAPRGERVTLDLPDGTHVVLGPESRIRYAVDRGVRVRTIYLAGRARFDVAHDPVHPFVVHASGGEAQAVGTSFGVRAYPTDSMLSVVVEEGRVALRVSGAALGSGTMLDAGQRGVLGHGLVRVEPNADIERELGWTNGHLAYDLAPLDMVVQDLERWFTVRIRLVDPSLQQVRVTVTLDADSVDASLRRLATVLETEVRRSGADVRLGR